MSEIETILLGIRDERTAPSEQQWQALSEFVSKQSAVLERQSVQLQQLSEQVQTLNGSSLKLTERVEVLTKLLQP